ncbi:MAG TPA: MFS transporter [Steroidobacteraceae bacterium]|nr:MFS transporter [Steroidobacteraceae bacterium]
MSLAEPGADGGGVSTRIVALLTLAAFINYVDRGNLATAGPLIQGQLNLSHTELGVLLAAFFWSYAPAQLPAGWLVQNCIGNFAGMTAPVVTGIVVDRTGHFASAFVIAAILAVVGILAFALIVRRIEPIEWRRPAGGRLVAALPRRG